MIRDPSDGSVRETPKIDVEIPASKPNGLDTGIRQPTRSDAVERLEKWRKWLKDYHAKKETAHARGNNGTELQAAGHSIEGQRAAKPAS